MLFALSHGILWPLLISLGGAMTRDSESRGLLIGYERRLNQQEKEVRRLLRRRRVKIGSDFDGSICDTNRLKAQLAKEMYGVAVSQHRLHRRFIAEDRLLTLAQYEEIKRLIYETEVGLRATGYRGGVEHIKLLVQLGCEVPVISNRTPVASALAEEWLHRQKLDLEFTGVGIEGSKVPAVEGCLMFVDNDADKLRELSRIVPRLFHLVVNRTWESDQDSGGAVRVYTWSEAYQKILDHLEWRLLRR